MGYPHPWLPHRLLPHTPQPWFSSPLSLPRKPFFSPHHKTSPHITINSEWCTFTTLNSDHQLILFQLGNSFEMNFLETPYRTFTHLKKADWDSFTRETEESFTPLELPSFCNMGESQAEIPHSQIHIPNTKKRLPIKRDALRSTSLTDPHIHELSRQISDNIADFIRQKWTQTVESCYYKCNAIRLWGIMKSLNS